MSAAEPILDAAVLEELRALGRQLEQDVLSDVVEAYRKLAPELAAEMSRAAAAADFERLRKAAHTLKGGSAQMGVRRVTSLARALEAEAREARGERLAELLAGLADELARADAELLRAAGAGR